jgi:hypothetical protein
MGGSTWSLNVLRGEFLRFALLGVAKTVATAVLFYVLATVLPAKAAYTLLWVAALGVTALVTPRYVFGVRASRLRIALLLAWYMVIWAVGIGIVSLLEHLSDSRAVITFGTVFVTAPFSFLGARYFVGGSRTETHVPQTSASGS